MKRHRGTEGGTSEHTSLNRTPLPVEVVEVGTSLNRTRIHDEDVVVVGVFIFFLFSTTMMEIYPEFRKYQYKIDTKK